MQKLARIALISFIFSLLQACAATGTVVNNPVTSTLSQNGRSLALVVDDNMTSIKIMQKVKKDPVLAQQCRIVPVTFNQVVLMTGQTPTVEQRNEALTIANTMPNIRKVFNDIAIQQPISYSVQGSDGLTTANVKTRLLTTTDVPSRSIKVVTENGTTYLFGEVSRDEGQAAAEVAKTSTGVKKVVLLFEYTK